MGSSSASGSASGKASGHATSESGKEIPAWDLVLSFAAEHRGKVQVAESALTAAVGAPVLCRLPRLLQVA